jgi:P4 family phage/plasmid primase-like protien
MKTTIEDVNKKMLDAGLEPLSDVDNCPERTAFVLHISDPQWGDKDWMKQYKFLANEYALEFHNYFASVYPYLVYERGEDKIYWNYREGDGVYVELNATEVRGLVLHLLRTEGLRDKATESNVRNVMARYRGDYKERGVDYGAFDQDDTWFHANNGWVNLETRVFEAHTPSRHSRVKSAVDYDADAICPTYDKFLEQDLHLKPDQVRVIDQFSGLSLTNDIKYQKMLTLLGRPGCGKSTLLNTWSQVLGEKAIEKKLPELTGEAMRFAGAQFVGATLCWFDEVDVKKSEMGNNLGTLITGETIQVERKGINGIVKANNTVKCVLTANRLPLTAEVGIYRRLIMIPIEVSFVENGTVDIDVPDRLKIEASGVLNRMIDGLQDLRKMRGFTVIDGHEDLIEDYKASSDTIAEFLDEYFEVGGEEDFVETTVLYKSYKQFVDGNNFMRSITPQKFGKLLSSQPLSRFSHIEAKRTKSARRWVGIKLKQDYEIDSYSDTIQTKKVLNF